MSMTEAQARAAVLAVAHSQVGYQPGRTNSLYGAWHGKRDVLWCACGSSWCFHQGLGDEPAFAAIWREFQGRKGWSWTVRWREWLQQYGRRVPLDKAQPGDQVFFKYPTRDSRNTNSVNHVDFAVGAKSDHVLTIGFNTPKPGSGGDPSNGRGVWYHRRPYTNRHIVDVYRPRWAAFVAAEPPKVTFPAPRPVPVTITPAVAGMLTRLRLSPDTAGVRAYQTAAGLTVDGRPGPLTTTSLEASMEQLDRIEKAVSGLTTTAATGFADLPARVWGTRLPHPGADRQARAHEHVVNNNARAAAALAQIAGLSATVTALATGQGADPAVIEAAARRGAASALADIQITIDTPEVTP